MDDEVFAEEAVEEEGDGGRGTEAVDDVNAEEAVAEEGDGGRGAEAVDTMGLTCLAFGTGLGEKKRVNSSFPLIDERTCLSNSFSWFSCGHLKASLGMRTEATVGANETVFCWRGGGVG